MSYPHFFNFWLFYIILLLIAARAVYPEEIFRLLVFFYRLVRGFLHRLERLNERLEKDLRRLTEELKATFPLPMWSWASPIFGFVRTLQRILWMHVKDLEDIDRFIGIDPD